MLLRYQKYEPSLGERCYIAPTAAVIGEVTLGADVSVWFGACIRGDSGAIRVGDGTNIQDNATIHCTDGLPVTIGQNVSIGHNAVVHSATLEDEVLVGMGAVVLDGAVVGRGSIVGAGAVVTKNSVIPPCSLVMGLPGKVIRQVGEGVNLENAETYRARKELYREGTCS